MVLSDVLHGQEELVRDGLAGFIVFGHVFEEIGFPEPIFHELRREFDEVPGDGCSCQRTGFYFGEEEVKHVSEFVEKSLCVGRGQQSRIASHRASDIGADQPQVRMSGRIGRCGTSKGNCTHPGAVTLAEARIDVQIERADVFVGFFIGYIEEADLRVPDFDGARRWSRSGTWFDIFCGAFGDCDAIEPVGQILLFCLITPKSFR